MDFKNSLYSIFCGIELKTQPVFIHDMGNIFITLRRRLRFYNSRRRAKPDRSQKVCYNIYSTPNLYGA